MLAQRWVLNKNLSPRVLPEHRGLPLGQLGIVEERHQTCSFGAEHGRVGHHGADVERLEPGGLDEGGEDVDKLDQLTRPQTRTRCFRGLWHGEDKGSVVGHLLRN